MRRPGSSLAQALARSPALGLVALGLLLGGCLPPPASYELGLGTSRISGFVYTDPAQPTPGGPLVVAFLYHHQFIEQADGSAVVSATARVLQPGSSGQFSLALATDVVRAELFFVAPEHLTTVFRFRRQLGVGDITYRAELEAMADWRSHYYTFLSPQLEALILEQRYRLPPDEQQALTAWMQLQDARLKPPPRRSQPD
jgi:hypothetical protein